MGQLFASPQRTRFRPCIDLHGGKVKQIVGATLTDGDEAPVTNFEASKSSADFAAMYRDDTLTGGHVIKLGPGNEEAALAALRAYPGGLQLGGGVTPENAAAYIEAGASHVIVTSYVFRNGSIDWERLRALVGIVGKEKLVLDLSCRQLPADSRGDDDAYYVVTDRWQKYTDFAVNKENLKILAEYCDEFLVHGVEVEGLKGGMLEDLIVSLGEWSPIPVTYAGGARSIEDLERVHALSGGRVDLTIGSALDIFGGDLAYEDVVRWDKNA
mmetsp:Transcript_934/g.2569  ORF Transcript_934/g.2569 Transcript_934/m.2569 type:complete len:270 (-) Transcript_934:72-881(-)